MLKFPAQLHNFRKTTIGDNLITLSIAGDYSDQVVDVVRKKIGTEFIVYLEDVTQTTNLNEDSVELKERFIRKMHVLIGEYAELEPMSKDLAKDLLKKELKSKGLIEKSTKELNIKGLAIACNIVEDWINNHGK